MKTNIEEMSSENLLTLKDYRKLNKVWKKLKSKCDYNGNKI